MVSAQLSFFQESPGDDPKRAALEKAVDQVRARFGRNVVKPGTPGVDE